MKLSELRQRQTEIMARLDELTAIADSEDWTETHQTEFDALETEYQENQSKIQQLEQQRVEHQQRIERHQARQQQHQLDTDGVAGPKTQNSLGLY